MPSTSNQTTVVAVGGSGRSVRTVIPLWVCEQMHIKPGDKISWNLKVEDGKMMMVVRRLWKDTTEDDEI
tara:strand:- start:221 stop:427 length:207 start_codon:yes stop_codon:yes gene_type:complete